MPDRTDIPPQTKAKSVGNLIADLDNAVLEGDPGVTISSIAFDSRKVLPRGMFVAMRGGYVDGHDYLQAALSAGAVAAMVEPDAPRELTRGFQCVVRVRNTRANLAPLSACFYEHPSRDLKVIGVTGTDGKTTTSWYIRDMITSLGSTAGMITTVSVHVPGRAARSSERQTTPESLDVQRTLREMVEAGADYAVLETTSHALETHRVDHCRFDIGAITNITREHLDFHGSIENYRNAKASLLRRVSQSLADGGEGVVVMNADDEGTRSVAGQSGDSRVLWYSAAGADDASIRALDVKHRSDSSSFRLLLDDQSAEVTLPLPGSWNVSNCLAAAGVLHALGYGIEEISGAISELRPVPGRMVNVYLGQDFAVIVDYAHTPESIRSVLGEARRLAVGRVLVAFGSAGERDIEKRAIQGRVAAELADYAVFTSEDPRFEDPNDIINAIASGAVQQGAIRGVDFDCIEDRRQAIEVLIGKAKPGDVVVLAGKGHEQSMIYGSENRPWDEVDVAVTALGNLGYKRDEAKGTNA